MSEIKKVVVNGNEYQFVNRSGNTRYGFYHKSELFKNGMKIGENKVNYLNRTWESYRYQNTMCGLVNSLHSDRYDTLLKNFKERNGYKKMTQKRMEEFASTNYTNDSILSELNQLNTALR